ncbi:MAG: arsinothricin resistance N-acetyltransferase ArsN1 [Azospirillaceae bacterium]
MPHQAADLVIRPATIDDAAAIQAIYAPVVEETVISFEEEPPSVSEMARRIAATLRDHPFLVANLDGVIAGYAYAGPYRSRPAYRWSVDVTVYVDPARHRRGIGRALYGALLTELARRGTHAAFAGIALPNPGSVALHEATGFVHAGTHREAGRKFGRWVDVGWWQYLFPTSAI